MNLTVKLLGRPALLRGAGPAYQFRSRKSWAVLAYLLRAERPPSRSQLSALLFPDADDPARALRWSLAEVRRGLGAGTVLEGDPLVLRLPPGTVVDLDVVTRGAWPDAVAAVDVEAELLEGLAVRGSAAFDTWLLGQRRHASAACEAALHEAALGAMSAGDLPGATAYAVRLVAREPLDENHQALLIRLYRTAGDDEAARAQLETCTELLARELGVEPGPVVMAAMRRPPQGLPGVTDEADVDALVEAGVAAVSAGAVDAGITSLRTAARFADAGGLTGLRIRARIALGEALVHATRGLDEDGLAALHEADRIAVDAGRTEAAAQARAELGYVDFLRARYDRAERHLADALALAGSSPAVAAKATTYLGSVAADRADYPRALALLPEAVRLARLAGEPRREAYALSMLGRLHLLRGDRDEAARLLDEAVALATAEHWLSFLPWPQAIRGEVQLRRGDADGAAELLRQAFARACRLGDPCWEGISGRGLALVAEATGDADLAFGLLADAAARCVRLADPYVWLEAYILDAQCELGVRHGHPATTVWVGRLRELASRAGMRELVVRSLLHGAALGRTGDLESAVLLAADLDNPALTAELDRSATGRTYGS
ncbi:tetratricopeptide repeat protein [Kineosporia sp. A_224]|uniref:tetratricopeptide repeat protein n=1 Tax=Kineosporia sp. A_224 TaxID=1962180 RepID=UPI000B4B0968|nr:tetratricopeptide repeat protein [Kineosporia sp. A_224]